MTSSVLFLFPGQGAQYPGIGSDLIAAHPLVSEIYQEASSILGYDLVELCSKNSSDDINLTKFTQPVLLVHSYACMELFKQQSGNSIVPYVAAGHSLGEYTALVAAGSLSFREAVKLVAKRGECMGKYGGGEMLALSLTAEQLNPLLENSNVELAALNLAEQTVAGGWAAELDELQEKIEQEYPGKGGVRLKTEGAFHTSHMYPAAQDFQPTLESAYFVHPQIHVASNTTGKFHSPDVVEIRTNLYNQLFRPVRWYENLSAIAEIGIDTIIEFGGGLGKGDAPEDKRPNLQGMMVRAFRRENPRPAYHSVINLQTLANTVESFS